MKIKAVCFDIDGTLYPNWQMVWLMLPAFLADIPLNRAYGKVRKQLRTLSWEGKEELPLRTVQAQLVKEELKSPLSVEETESLIETNLYRRWVSDFKRVKGYPQVKEALTLIRAQGLKTGVLSDFPIQNKLRYLNLSKDCFDVALCSETVGRLKPDKRPFLALAEALECDPSEVLYVGNSYEKDIVGANRVEMLTAHLTRKRPKETVANFSFRDFGEFIKKIKTLMI